MQRHRFDAISFFFGLLFSAIATYVLVVDDVELGVEALRRAFEG